MLLKMNHSSKQALYIQVYEQIKKKILNEELVKGQKLPSKRQLAMDNGISQNTVINAYDQLQVEGYIRSEQRRGYFVEDIDFQLSPLRPNPKPSSPSLETDKEEKTYLDLTRSNPDSSLFPSSIFSKIMNRLLASSNPKYLEASSHQGLYELRDVLAAYLDQSRGIPSCPDQLVLAPNSQNLLHVIFNLYENISEIGMEEPGYHGYRSFFKMEGVKEKSILVEEDGISIEGIYQSGVDTVFLTPNHQFPTGSIMPLDRRQQLLTWAKEKPNRLIIEDDYDGEFKYSGIPVPPLSQLDHRNQVIYLGSFTRVLAPGIRLSYMVLPEKMVASYQKRYKSMPSSLNSLIQYSLYYFMKDGHFTRHLNRSRRLYKKKRDRLIKAIKQEDTQSTIYGEEAGLSILIRPSKSFNGQKLKVLADKKGIKLSLLSDYMGQAEPADEKIIFISFSSIPLEDIELLIKEIGRLMSKSLE